MYGLVESTERITPAIVRVVFGGAGLDRFEGTEFTDQYVKATFDVEGSDRPASRRYTVRRWNPTTRKLTIDFVVHGDVGVAGRWAAGASAGDRLSFAGPSGGYRPDSTAAWYLMSGDESAMPAIAASLEQIPRGRVAIVVLLVDDASHELPLESPADLRLTWVHRSAHPDPSAAYLDAIRRLSFPPGEVSAFVHGEAAETRAVRRHLLADRSMPRNLLSVSPYWRRGHTDEAWREVKRDWLAEVETDVANR